MTTCSKSSARLLLVLPLVLTVAPLAASAADDYPNRVIRIIAPTAPGAGTRIGSEIVAKRPRTVEQVPRALARGCDPIAGCKRRT